MAGCGEMWNGMVCGLARHGVVLCGIALVWRGTAWCGVLWNSVVYRGAAWCGLVWNGVL